MAQKEYKTKTENQGTANLGKVPPQALELEEAVLGAIMIDKDAANTVLEILKPECFYSDSNRKIYEAISALFKEMQPIDILTVKDELVRRKQLEETGGALYLTKLAGRVASAAHSEFHARIILQKYIQRELIRIATDIEKKAFDDEEDIDDLLDFSQNQIFGLSDGTVRRESQPIDVVIKESLEQIKIAGERVDGLSGVPSGFSDIDRITSGWQKSDLIVIAGRPSMGKTAFVLSMARNIAVNHKQAVGFFSLEMSSVQLVNRLLVAETEIRAEIIRTGKLSREEWNILDAKIKTLENCNIYIDDTPAISIFELRSKARRLVSQHDVKLIIIDYLQLMNSPNDYKGTREQEVSTISRSLKALAKDLNVPIIALSQLNRSVETRTGSKHPQLSDLRESGAIEQDADIVIFIHRPEKYGFNDEDGSLKGLAEIIIAKHRNGAVANVNLKFIENFAKFTDWDEFGTGSEIDNQLPIVVMPSKMNKSNSDKTKSESNRSFEDENKAPY
ncbi:MAG: replicative DNA helicase [Bacteroidetes bacterium CG23_combo_of_CG06-09_8_20_14_all_32_9]|nr:MAG: replicative DNA helicase [Bacteroidetes bacterium CG23_combo_of_CG06-09_8_20_14_all_32_9]